MQGIYVAVAAAKVRDSGTLAYTALITGR